MSTAAKDGQNAAVAPIPLGERLLAWKEILETANPPRDRPLDTVGKWLVITRAAVFPMTIWSGLIGGLLAVEAARTAGGAAVDWGLFGIAVVGLVLAHAANNMINDYFDTASGIDTDDYVRALYAPHPILAGWVTKRQLAAAILIVNTVDALLMLYLASVRGPLIIAFALGGLFVSVFYVAPPIRLKHHGLGEPGVFLVWGPLMVGGTFLAATGTIAPWVLLVSVPYALLVTSVLFGKHIDKIEADRKLGVRTLPVILGEARADRRTVADGRLLPAHDPGRRRRPGRSVGPARRPRDPAAADRPEGLRPAEAARSTARLSGARLAALVRRLCVHPHAPRRRPVHAGPAAQRADPDPAALALAARAERASRPDFMAARPGDGTGIRGNRAW